MTDAADHLEEKPVPENPTAESGAEQDSPIWLRASLADLTDLDFEAPISESQSADSDELSQRFRAAAERDTPNGSPETPAARVFSMLAAVTGMYLKAQEPSAAGGYLPVA
jgi:hypothetical protein